MTAASYRIDAKSDEVIRVAVHEVANCRRRIPPVTSHCTRNLQHIHMHTIFCT